MATAQFTDDLTIHQLDTGARLAILKRCVSRVAQVSIVSTRWQADIEAEGGVTYLVDFFHPADGQHLNGRLLAGSHTTLMPKLMVWTLDLDETIGLEATMGDQRHERLFETSIGRFLEIFLGHSQSE